MQFAFATIYGLANIMLMMWWGYGGSQTFPAFFQLLPVSMLVYIALCLVAIYLPLAKASVATRNSVRYAVFAPWVLLLVIVIPQVVEGPSEVLIMCAGAAVVWFMYVPGERIARLVNGDDEET